MVTARTSTTSTQLRDPLVLPGLAHGHHQGTDARKNGSSVWWDLRARSPTHTAPLICHLTEVKQAFTENSSSDKTP